MLASDLIMYNETLTRDLDVSVAPKMKTLRPKVQ